MGELPLSFNLNIFIFSIVNFAILFIILKKFLFGPMLNILEQRKTKIKESLDQVRQTEQEREKVRTEKEEIIFKAEKESQGIIQQAEKMKKDILNQGKDEADRIIKASRDSIEKEREDLKKEMHVMLIDLVTASVNKALASIGRQENQGRIIETSILQSLQEASVESAATPERTEATNQQQTGNYNQNF